MKNRFHVRVLSWSMLREIEGAWGGDDFIALLDAMEYGETSGMSPDELREMCILSLQDQGMEKAAVLVLTHCLRDRLKAGQIENLAREMAEDKLWEEYSDMGAHERLFNVGSLLSQAFPGSFPEPDAVRVVLEVVAANEPGREALADGLHESLVVRLLAGGMDETAVLHRLFDEQIDGPRFPEADSIVWIVQTDVVSADTVKLDVVSSGYWLDPLREAEAYDSTAYADRE